MGVQDILRDVSADHNRADPRTTRASSPHIDIIIPRTQTQDIYALDMCYCMNSMLSGVQTSPIYLVNEREKKMYTMRRYCRKFMCHEEYFVNEILEFVSHSKI